MKNDELKHLCRKLCEDDNNYLCFDRCEKKDQGRYFVCNESKNTYFKCTTESDTFLIYD